MLCEINSIYAPRVNKIEIKGILCLEKMTLLSKIPESVNNYWGKEFIRTRKLYVNINQHTRIRKCLLLYSTINCIMDEYDEPTPRINSTHYIADKPYNVVLK